MARNKFLQKLFGGNRSAEFTMQTAIDRFLAGDDMFPVETSAGVAVNSSNSLQVTAVYACVRIIAWSMGICPVGVFRDMEPRGKVANRDHNIYRLLKSPNPIQTGFKFTELLSIHQNLWGAGIAEIEFDNSGFPVALWPLPPWCVTPKKAKTGDLFYEVDISGQEKRTLTQYQTIVFPAMSTSPYQWQSPIATHRDTIGFSMALQDFGAKTFGQGTNPAGMISMEGALTEKAEKSLKERMKAYSGLSHSHRLMLLDNGMKFDRVGLPPEDAQYLETRKYQVSDIARIFNVPLHLLQDHEKNTSWGRGIEEMNQGYVTYTLLPYLIMREEELNRRLFDEDDPHYVKYNVNGLLRGRINERYAAYTKGRQWGWLSANDVREFEDMNPLPDDQGDMYLVPANMQSAESVSKNDNSNKGNGDGN